MNNEPTPQGRSGKGRTSYTVSPIDQVNFLKLIKVQQNCHVWCGKNGNSGVLGRPPIPLIKLEDGSFVSARRVAWQESRGLPIPKTVFVTCGNPLCVKGSHLTEHDPQPR